MTDAEIAAALQAVLNELKARAEGQANPEPPHEHPTPPPSGWVKAIAPIASDLNVDDWLQKGEAPRPQGSDPTGAFRIGANASHLNYDDPVVYPGQPGAAHLHVYFGNRTTDAFSTYESLRANPHSTTDTDMINGSAYWKPALLSGNGNVVMPELSQVYYKSWPKDKPPHPDAIGVGIPAGMRFLMKGGLFSLERKGQEVGVANSRYDLSKILEVAQVGDVIVMAVSSHQFWDGEHIDSPDHMAHLSRRFSPSHRFYIPQLTIRFNYKVEEGDFPKLWHLSSDMGAVPGSSLHADYIEAWEPSVRETWQRLVIDGHLSTSNGNLGNGKAGKPWPGFSRAQRPHLIPIPARPNAYHGGHH